MVLVTLARAAAVGAAGFVVAVVAEIPTTTLLGTIIAIELAQFALTVEHRGRLAALEARADDEARRSGGEP